MVVPLLPYNRAKPYVLAEGSEDGLVSLVGGHEAGDDGPELGSVVGFTEVGELVDEDVVDKASQASAVLRHRILEPTAQRQIRHLNHVRVRMAQAQSDAAGRCSR